MVSNARRQCPARYMLSSLREIGSHSLSNMRIPIPRERGPCELYRDCPTPHTRYPEMGAQSFHALKRLIKRSESRGSIVSCYRADVVFQEVVPGGALHLRSYRRGDH
jgi:hypothetical protein